MTSEPNKFLAVSYLTDAKQYAQAARILFESRQEKISSPQYFLISQGIELFLKAFVIAAGGTKAEVTKDQKVRHSLQELAKKAAEHGYTSRSTKTLAVIELLAPHHIDHSFRYRKVGFKTYPTIREGLDTLDRMDREISPVVARSIPTL